MGKSSTSWRRGKSGNPQGRPKRERPLTEMLKLKGEDQVELGGEIMDGGDAVAKAVWQFVLTGEVGLQGKKLQANSISEWLYVVKWLYRYLEPPMRGEVNGGQEVKVGIVREGEDE